MDKTFIITSMKALLPILVVLSFLYVSGHLSSDFYFHTSNTFCLDYPPFLCWMMALLGENRSLSLFILNLLFTTILPYCLIHRITQKFEPAWVYLYSGIPLVLFVVWLVPQAILHCLMLLAVLNPFGLVVFALLGESVHGYWMFGYALVVIFLLYRLKTTGKFYA